MDYQEFICQAEAVLSHSETDAIDSRVSFLNELRLLISKHSPFKTEPVDCVQWVKSETVAANDYNPNTVAPPEMELLRVSINNDGYTQPVVTWNNGENIEVVDGFHRTRVCKEFDDVKIRVHGYLPVVSIKKDNEDRNNRIASTIRHNRARGKHRVDAMSDIVLELKNRNWKNARIAKELGMDEDEILRLCQITGLADLFSDDDFSKSWDIEGSEDAEFIPLDEFSDISESEQVRTVNTNDENRIFHKYDKWECHKAGFYKNSVPGKTKEECEIEYSTFLSDIDRFSNALDAMIIEWKHSCEHYLTNQSINRIAWLGQAAMCYATGIPMAFRSGFNLLTKKQQIEADETALKYLNKWLSLNGMDEVTIDQANPGKQSTIY